MADLTTPILGADMETGTLVAWRKQPGDPLDRGDIIAEGTSWLGPAPAPLRSSELSDPTVTVTSLGERGVDAVFPVIHPPQVAIFDARLATLDGAVDYLARRLDDERAGT
jgi:pyruvate/2-oxoglutarate dehydrogenase complex dihydrolipoamide acyltransferase (E2) component